MQDRVWCSHSPSLHATRAARPGHDPNSGSWSSYSKPLNHIYSNAARIVCRDPSRPRSQFQLPITNLAERGITQRMNTTSFSPEQTKKGGDYLLITCSKTPYHTHPIDQLLPCLTSHDNYHAWYEFWERPWDQYLARDEEIPKQLILDGTSHKKIPANVTAGTHPLQFE